MPANLHDPGAAVREIAQQAGMHPAAGLCGGEGRGKARCLGTGLAHALDLSDISDFRDQILDRLLDAGLKCQCRGRTTVTGAKQADLGGRNIDCDQFDTASVTGQHRTDGGQCRLYALMQ